MCVSVLSVFSAVKLHHRRPWPAFYGQKQKIKQNEIYKNRKVNMIFAACRLYLDLGQNARALLTARNYASPNINSWWRDDVWRCDATGTSHVINMCPRQTSPLQPAVCLICVCVHDCFYCSYLMYFISCNYVYLTHPIPYRISTQIQIRSFVVRSLFKLIQTTVYNSM